MDMSHGRATTLFVDRLEQAKRRPLLVAGAIRTAIRDAVAWRIGGGVAPNSAAFITAAVATARLMLDAHQSDATQSARTLAAVQRTAKAFTASALYRRLMTVPASRFLRLPSVSHGPDVVVRDFRRRVHAIVVTARSDALDAGRLATAVAGATNVTAADRLPPLCVHIYSLASGHLQTFEREISACQISRGNERVA